MKDDISSEAFVTASFIVGSSDARAISSEGHSFHYYYQAEILKRYSEEVIIMGIIAGYDRDACTANHHKVFVDCLQTDECRMFRHPNGNSDHFNIRWFKEWCKTNRPRVLKVINNTKAFW